MIVWDEHSGKRKGGGVVVKLGDDREYGREGDFNFKIGLFNRLDRHPNFLDEGYEQKLYINKNYSIRINLRIHTFRFILLRSFHHICVTMAFPND